MSLIILDQPKPNMAGVILLAILVFALLLVWAYRDNEDGANI